MRLVICLYEQAIEDLRCAVIALEKGDIEARTRGINHALTVIAQLQGSLDMERGGEVHALGRVPYLKLAVSRSCRAMYSRKSSSLWVDGLATPVFCVIIPAMRWAGVMRTTPSTSYLRLK